MTFAQLASDIAFGFALTASILLSTAALIEAFK